MTKDQRFELTIESSIENLPAAVAFISDSMIRLGMDEILVPRMELAADEALTNVIMHAYGGGKGKIFLACSREGDDYLVSIRDKGKPFDPRTVPPPDLEASVEDRKVGGLGIYFMKKLMDDVSYSFDPEKGNELVLRKKAAPGPP